MTLKWWTVRGTGPWTVARMVPSWQAALSYIYQLPRKAHFVEVTLDGETRHYERGANYSWKRVTNYADTDTVAGCGFSKKHCSNCPDRGLYDVCPL